MTSLRFDRLAFRGGGFMYVVGSLNDVMCFFDLIERFVAPSLTEADRLLVLDRIYKRYLRIEDTPAACKAMNRVQEELSRVESSSIDWEAYNMREGDTRLKIAKPALSDVTAHFFTAFAQCASAAVYNATQTTGGFLQPVIICRSDFGSQHREDSRPLEEYDTLEGAPFWMAGP